MTTIKTVLKGLNKPTVLKGAAATGVIAVVAAMLWRARKMSQTQTTTTEAATTDTGSDQIDGFVEIDLIRTEDGYVFEETITSLQH